MNGFGSDEFLKLRHKLPPPGLPCRSLQRVDRRRKGRAFPNLRHCRLHRESRDQHLSRNPRWQNHQRRSARFQRRVHRMIMQDFGAAAPPPAHHCFRGFVIKHDPTHRTRLHQLSHRAGPSAPTSGCAQRVYPTPAQIRSTLSCFTWCRPKQETARFSYAETCQGCKVFCFAQAKFSLAARKSKFHNWQTGCFFGYVPEELRSSPTPVPGL